MDNSLNCPRFGGIPENPEHVIFCRSTLAMKRGALIHALGGSVSPENLVAKILRSKEKWLTVSSPIVKILLVFLKEESRRDQKDECLKANSPREVIPNGGPAG